MRLDLSAPALTDRLRAASAASDLAPEKRLDAKIDLSAAAVTGRLREASELLRVCRALAAARVTR